MDISSALQSKIDHKTKPLGSLGRLEELALQIGRIQNTLAPRLIAPHLLVCAGDHGAAKAGISAYPQEVTWQMVENFLAGGAAINVLSRQAGMTLVVADAGVAHDFGVRPRLVDAKVAYGTDSYLDGAAMTPAQCLLAMTHGEKAFNTIATTGCNVIGFGEMGIGNTASASLMTHCLTGTPLCVGRGTGLDDAGLARKQALLTQALVLWPDTLPPRQGEGWGGDGFPLAVLARYGGFEIAMLVGAMQAAAKARCLLLIDGFIVTSALLVAHALQPSILDYCVFAHRSGEPGHSVQLAYLKARPLLELDLRLGEGTGAALAYPILVSACAFLSDMASFESAGVESASSKI
ncbi:MAG: nicotinate-nucleotide--dimethylbenzimidazole phosphoribosyltransferase [Rhodocyclaceae bacterium]|nr:nicotinate-nucleotide--dimethylbenzimidazole phosphoribosyltransferase [Rhodocyclaceae bacterium]